MRCRFSSKNANTWSCVTAATDGIVLDAGVVVGDERDAGVVHAELAREIRLGILRHVDDVPALRAVPGRLGARGEARALHDHDGAAFVHRHTDPRARVDRGRGDDRAVRIGERHVVAEAGVVERVGPAPRAVDELVEHDEVAGMHVRPQRAGRARPDDRAHAERPQRPEVGAGRAPRRARGDGRGRGAAMNATCLSPTVPIVIGSLGGPNGVSISISSAVVEEAVEARPAEDADVGRAAHAGSGALGRRLLRRTTSSSPESDPDFLLARAR